MAGNTTTDSEAAEAGPMTFSELVSLNLQLAARHDMLWQRVLYTHVGIVGVMVFFSSAEQIYLVPRVLVYAFYTANLIITVYSFAETLAGMRAVIADLRALQGEASKTEVQKWVARRNYDRHTAVRLGILGVTWAIIGYLLIVPLFLPVAPMF